VPYLGPETNATANGILLRGDVHTLFDLGLIAVDSATMKVVVAEQLLGTSYEALHGSVLALPAAKNARPHASALDYHREWAGL
jgi:hypothetical protein